MSGQDYFKSALSNFTHEAASGGAIRHLADLGYTVKQITERLTFPTPEERVRREVWERLVDTGVILLEEPGSGGQREKAVFVEERDRFGRVSFRRVAAEGEHREVLWKERYFEVLKQRESRKQGNRMHQSGNPRQCEGISRGGTRRLAEYLSEKSAENGEGHSYCSCSFGVLRREDPAGFQAAMELLDGRQREYVEGLPWERKICYHRLDLRMREIVERLYENERYGGAFYFLKTEEKVFIGTAADSSSDGSA